MEPNVFEQQNPWPLFEEEGERRDMAWWRSLFCSGEKRIEPEALAAMSDEVVYWAGTKLRGYDGQSSGAGEYKRTLRALGAGGSDWFDAKADEESSYIAKSGFIESLPQIARGELGVYQEGCDEFLRGLRKRYELARAAASPPASD